MHDVFIYDGIRTPFGRHGGSLASVRPDELLAACLKAVIERSGLDPAGIEDVVIGDANQAGEDCRNIARNALLLAGLPQTVSGITVNRLCGSSAAAVLDASRALKLGEGNWMLAGGVESMSRAPFVLGKAESAYAREQKIYDTVIGWRFPNARLLGNIGEDAMGDTADNVARELGISRADSDVFAAASHQRYARALAEGFFKDELLPIEIPSRKGAPTMVAADEHPRPDTTVEKLAQLKPIARDGVVTAGNASGINDGAAALLLGTREAGAALGLKPRARIVTGAVAGVAPRVMGLGPVPASHKALARAGLHLNDMSVIEINEAFAPQVLGCLKQFELAFDDVRVNPNGGAIAIGHPLGASGARLTLTAMRELERRDGRYALVSMCIGIGQGIALILERAA